MAIYVKIMNPRMAIGKAGGRQAPTGTLNFTYRQDGHGSEGMWKKKKKKIFDRRLFPWRSISDRKAFTAPHAF